MPRKHHVQSKGRKVTQRLRVERVALPETCMLAEEIDALQSAIAQAVRAPEVASQLRGLGAEPVASRPEDFARQIRADLHKWRGVVKATGVVLE